jgi:outer membrane biogenesis lipoprotein LolB
MEVEMNILKLPIMGLKGKDYAFRLFLDNHLASKRALSNSEKWQLDTTDIEIIGRN